MLLDIVKCRKIKVTPFLADIVKCRKIKVTPFLALLFLVNGCNSAVPGLYPPQPGEKQYVIYIVNNHWHTGMAIHSRDLSPRMLELTRRSPDSGWIEIGWGDQGFYTASKVTTGLSLQAMFYSRGSVLHIWTLPDAPGQFYENYQVDLYRIGISESGHQKLMQRLEGSFAIDGDHKSRRLQNGLFDDSDFFLAKGRYSVFHTCNHWTADTIRTTGFPITPHYSLTANNVGWQIRHFGRDCELPGEKGSSLDKNE